MIRLRSGQSQPFGGKPRASGDDPDDAAAKAEKTL